MLFDLRGRGRRRTVKIVYITLAFLMGGGLVLFGIGGGGALSGGLVDAITESGGGGGSGEGRLRDEAEEATAAARANPDDAALWAAVARARYNLAASGENIDQNSGSFTDEGVALLRDSTRAWEEHVELAGENPDTRVASLMVQAYSQLGEPAKATLPQELIAEERDSAGTYASLAQLAYAAGQIRKGDLATQKALQLTEPDMRESLRGQLEAFKAQAASQAGQGAQEPAPEPTPTPEAE